jgi:probable F420-dependent oxidoreductase
VKLDLGRVGIWSPSFVLETADTPQAAAELEELGFGALWLGSADPGLRLPEQLLGATRRLVVATGIVNVFAATAEDVAAAYHRVDDAYPDRFVLGLGNSHAPIVERLGQDYSKPLRYLGGFLDGLDGAPRPVPADRRVLAALGPKALRLAAERSAGAHPYLTTPEHTARARAALGPGPLLAPEAKVVLETDPSTARDVARSHLRYYFELPNYVRNLRTLGYSDEDFAGGGSDRIVDALYAWGTPEQAARRVAEHHAAGADHVAVQVISPGTNSVTRTGVPPREGWRALAGVLL